jgi:hypothetical protein
MSTLINVVQSARDHKVHRDMEEGRATEATEASRMYHTAENNDNNLRQASRSLQDIRVIRRKKKAEDICMSECKACICLSFATVGLLYALAVFIIFIVESQRDSYRPALIPEDGSLS